MTPRNYGDAAFNSAGVVDLQGAENQPGCGQDRNGGGHGGALIGTG
jgi:hypothetical protein